MSLSFLLIFIYGLVLVSVLVHWNNPDMIGLYKSKCYHKEEVHEEIKYLEFNASHCG